MAGGACAVGETVTAVDGMQPTGIHYWPSCDEILDPSTWAARWSMKQHVLYDLCLPKVNHETSRSL